MFSRVFFHVSNGKTSGNPTKDSCRVFTGNVWGVWRECVRKLVKHLNMVSSSDSFSCFSGNPSGIYSRCFYMDLRKFLQELRSTFPEIQKHSHELQRKLFLWVPGETLEKNLGGTPPEFLKKLLFRTFWLLLTGAPSKIVLIQSRNEDVRCWSSLKFLMKLF